MRERVYNPCDVQGRLDEYVAMVQKKVNRYFEIMEYTFAAPPEITLSLIHI